MNYTIYIVIPAYNEAARIAQTLADVRKNGFHNIVVVDDGSVDATGEIARDLAVVVRHAVNRGMGAALATGTQYALRHGADIIVHFDADGQHHADEIARVIAPLQNNITDIVLGSRYLQDNKLPWSKKYLIHGPALIVQNITSGMRLSDVHNGFRAMNRAAAERIDILQDRMAHASEIISEIKRNRLRYVEVPVTISYHEYGQGITSGLKIYKDLVVKKIVR